MEPPSFQNENKLKFLRTLSVSCMLLVIFQLESFMVQLFWLDRLVVNPDRSLSCYSGIWLSFITSSVIFYLSD